MTKRATRYATKRTSEEVFAKADGSLMKHYPLSGLVANRAKGNTIATPEGRIIFDAIAGYAADAFGHGNPQLMEHCRQYFTPFPDGTYNPGTVPNKVVNTNVADAADALTKLTVRQFFVHAGTETDWRVLFSNGGVEAVEAAIKLVRKWANRSGNTSPKIVVAKNNFHGRTTTVVGFSSEPKYRDAFGPYASNAFLSVPFGDLPALEQMLVADRSSAHPVIAAVMIEPIQGEGGVVIPHAGYLSGVRELCNKYGALMVVDEIQTGLWRTGKFLAVLHERVVPDIVVMGKALGAGIVPVSAVLAQTHCAVFEKGDHGSTLGGSSFPMSVTLRVLKLCEELDLGRTVPSRGALLLAEITKRLTGPSLALVKEIRCKGLMLGIEMKNHSDAPLVIKALAELREAPLLTNDAHGAIRITPPLVIQDHECVIIATSIAEAFAAVAKEKEHKRACK